MKLINKILVIFSALLLNTNLALSGEKWDMAVSLWCWKLSTQQMLAEFAKNV